MVRKNLALNNALYQPHRRCSWHTTAHEDEATVDTLPVHLLVGGLLVLRDLTLEVGEATLVEELNRLA
eukprot:CAMPEP_0177387308 /NCGR_PEP_ID=MMETSP0368-20130122/51307_1 /TAXON_ID=447022 ORGANISM="Scrippsiella hangoei-like, Strain SHHI-4" /NCGR_SAMPLE_ID=MMETSP0368 /ASSEMBLY_ACC=CAM_ASM_000363 /LENGTH=67 /DNA_ID=CAMNT_0018852333 /DNA_START=16 /DNA_END=216 /DNA_ORIENTATION=-